MIRSLAHSYFDPVMLLSITIVLRHASLSWWSLSQNISFISLSELPI